MVLLSRYPITASDAFKFNRGVFGDRIIAKGIVYARLEVALRRHIHVFVAHLQTPVLRYGPPTTPRNQPQGGGNGLTRARFLFVGGGGGGGRRGGQRYI